MGHPHNIKADNKGAPSKGRRGPVVEPPFILALDIGSSSVKAMLFDVKAQPVMRVAARRTHALHADSDGAAEEMVEHLVERVEEVLDEVLQRAGAKAQHIASVGLDTLASTVMGLNQDGQPITAIYTYADTRSREDVRKLRQELDIPVTYQRTGCPVHTAYLPARLLWLQRTCPDICSQVRRWVDIGTYLYMRWFGLRDAPVSYSIASWSGLLDRGRMQWDAPLLGYLGLTVDALPKLADHTQTQRGLVAPFSRRWPSLRDVPFTLAVGDGFAANVGSGCVSARQIALTVGTSGAMRILLPDPAPAVQQGLWAYRVDTEHTLVGGSLSEGGNVFDWASKTLRLPPVKHMTSALRALPPDGHGLTMLPFLAGERSPGWSTATGGILAGLKMSTTAVELLQAFLEGVAYRFGLVAEALNGYGNTPLTTIVSGGALMRSPYWVQVLADVLQRPLVLSGEAEATSRGVAILALRSLKLWQAFDSVPALHGDIYEPDHARSMVYQAAIQRQRRLYETFIGHDDQDALGAAAMVIG